MSMIWCVFPDVQFIPTEKGKYILVLRGFTYSQVGGRFFYCSSKHVGCRARVRVTSGTLVPSGDAHNHPPPSHARCGNGAFVRLQPQKISCPSDIVSSTDITSKAIPFISNISSAPQLAIALQAYNFSKVMPKTDLWSTPLNTSGSDKTWTIIKTKL